MNRVLKYAIAGVIVILLVVGVVLYLNSGHLSRSNAKAQLTKLMVSTPVGHELMFQIGTISGACSGVGKDYDVVEESAEYPMLSDIGYVTVQPIKKHVWRVELTERGKKSIVGDRYGHKQDIDCDQWQVSMPVSKFNHFDITGILEEGKHAKVDLAFTFLVTPVGIDARKVAKRYVFESDKKKYGQELAEDFNRGNLETLLGDDVVYLAPSETTYVKRGSIMFNKYDNGWRVDVNSSKDEK